MKKLFVLFAILLITGITGINFGQTLHKDAVIAVRSFTIVLQPDVTMNQYIEFYKNKVIPEVEKYYPGIKVFLLTGERGAKKNQLGLVWYFDSPAIRDKYWPTEDSEGSDLSLEAEKKLEYLNAEFDKYVVSINQEYTDWIIR